MHTTFARAAGLALVSYALAAPEKTLGAIRIDQVKAGKVFINGALATLQTYEKFGVEPPPSVVKAAAAATQTARVPATPDQYDTVYLIPVSIGSTTLNLDPDSGSSDFMVDSNVLPADCIKIETWSNYEESGYVCSDKVAIGAATATGQWIEATTSGASGFSNDENVVGNLGLAPTAYSPACKPKPCPTFLQTIGPSLKQQVFTTAFKKGATGVFTLGYIDSTLYTGAITYVSADVSQGFWGFTAGGYSVGTSTSVTGSVGKSIVDTGTTLLYLPSSVVSSYYSHVSGASNSATYGGWVFPCSASLPNFNVAIGGTVFTIPGSYVNFAPANNAGTTCFGGIQANTGIGMSIFGLIFVKSAYCIFDLSAPQLGFAKLK